MAVQTKKGGARQGKKLTTIRVQFEEPSNQRRSDSSSGGRRGTPRSRTRGRVISGGIEEGAGGKYRKPQTQTRGGRGKGRFVGKRGGAKMRGQPEKSKILPPAPIVEAFMQFCFSECFSTNEVGVLYDFSNLKLRVEDWRSKQQGPVPLLRINFAEHGFVNMLSKVIQMAYEKSPPSLMSFGENDMGASNLEFFNNIGRICGSTVQQLNLMNCKITCLKSISFMRGFKQLQSVYLSGNELYPSKDPSVVAAYVRDTFPSIMTIDGIPNLPCLPPPEYQIPLSMKKRIDQVFKAYEKITCPVLRHNGVKHAFVGSGNPYFIETYGKQMLQTFETRCQFRRKALVQTYRPEVCHVLQTADSEIALEGVERVVEHYITAIPCVTFKKDSSLVKFTHGVRAPFPFVLRVVAGGLCHPKDKETKNQMFGVLRIMDLVPMDARPGEEVDGKAIYGIYHEKVIVHPVSGAEALQSLEQAMNQNILEMQQTQQQPIPQQTQPLMQQNQMM